MDSSEPDGCEPPLPAVFELAHVCVQHTQPFSDCGSDTSTLQPEESKLRIGLRAVEGVLTNVATGIADVLIADDRISTNHITPALSKYHTQPTSNLLKRQLSAVKTAVARYTGIPKAAIGEIIKALVLTAFIFIGIGVFLRGESDYYCRSEVSEAVMECYIGNDTTPIIINGATQDELGQCGWTVVDALYFSVVTISTVGYGDLTPSDPGMKVFTICFILAGIVAVFPKISTVVISFTTPISSFGRRVLDRMFPPTGIDINGDGEADFRAPRHPLIFYPKNLLPSILLWWTIQLASAAVFVAIEPEGTYWLWLYHCMVTATTVGYGDVSVTTQRGRLWAVFHIVLSVCGLADILATNSRITKERSDALAQMRQLNRRLDPNLVETLLQHAKTLRPHMERDGEGLHDLEFAFAMLIELGIISHKQVKPFLKLFHKMDIDGNGRVGRGDLKTMLQGAEPVEVPLIPVNDGASCSPELHRHSSVSLSRAVDQTGTAQVVSTDETVDVVERHDGSAAAGEHEESSHVGGIPRGGRPSKDGPNPRGLYPPGLENQMGERV